MDETTLKEVLNETLENTRDIATKWGFNYVYTSVAFLVKIAYVIGLTALRINPASRISNWDLFALFCVVLGIGLFKIHWLLGFIIWYRAFNWLGAYYEL